MSSICRYRNSSIDRILLVHALEVSDDPAELLREIWRVLAPSGRIIIVLPNRRGPWARADATPFGNGRPYSRSQLTSLLRETWFTPSAWSEALHVPPIRTGWFLRSAIAWERFGSAISSPFAGVHIVEATKQVYRPVAVRRERRRLIPVMEPVLVPTTSPRADGRPSGRSRTPMLRISYGKRSRKRMSREAVPLAARSNCRS